jgi:amino acid transporter
MSILVLINLFFAGFSSMTVTSRIGFAMARDNAFPGSKFLYHVTAKNKVPDRLIILVFLIDFALVLLPLQALSPPYETSGFTAITSITTIGY